MNQQRWDGFYYDGQTAERQPVTLTLVSGGLRLAHSDGSTVVWPIDELRQTQGSFSSEQLRIERGGGSAPIEVVLVNEPGLAGAIRQAFPGVGRKVRGSRSTARLLAWGLGGLASAAALYLWGAPLAADWTARRVPPSWEAGLGASVAERLAPAGKLCGDSAELASVRAVLDRLLAAGPKTPYDFRLLVVRDTMVNAFAAPGGFIAVNSGLLAAARTPEEFAGVLAHEIQHVTNRHSTRAMLREVPLRLALSAIGAGSGMETAASVVGSLGALRYRRADEAEADREGMRLLHAARVDASGMISFMRTLEGSGDSPPRFVSYLSSHPQTAERVAQLEALARERRAEPTPLLDSARWERVRVMCAD